MLLLSALHLIFPKRFRWKEDLARLQDINRQIFLVHCFFICLILVLMGALCLFFPHTLLEGGDLRKVISGGLAIFWFLRLITQHFVYDSKLWRGKPLETTVHILFTILWSYFTAVFVGVYVTSP